ncbi:hypothetical protein AXT60_25020 [Salmonella enterica subsp. enterica]|uniref:hypothetical protein n=1 Tax=Serratia TaxID=613 RepID=UPI0011AB8A68|nr:MULTISPECIES: hypothetical protein [Serratia]EBQ2012531.1 hypothetical protein [Salmonella enterica subsp. enterica]ECJ6738159.1 hypothetical protein [Salmonella enterica subsp. enterica]MBH3120562.1 hypothetical protein [Serratia ureilytica]
MKLIINKKMTMTSGGSVHRHVRSDGSYSGGGDYLSSLPVDANDHRWNHTTGKAVGASTGALWQPVGVPRGGFLGGLIGGAIGAFGE